MANEMTQMPTSRRRQLLRLSSVILAAVPVAFGLIRLLSTGDDARYLWLAAAALLGSMAVAAFGRGASGPSRVLPGRALGAITAGTACAAATAVLMGATAGPGVAIVAAGFGLCTGTSAALAILAREPRTP